MYQPKISRRWPLASYIARHARDFFKLLVVDECHQYKSGSSDRGRAYGQLCDAIGPVLNLTGTFYGGVASSIFYLLYRSQPTLRQEWAYGEERRWIETFGRIQKTYKTGSALGKHSAHQKKLTSRKEIPGIAPTILRHLLKTAIFRSVKDLGIMLPKFTDEVISLPMAPAQQASYDEVYQFTWQEVKTWKSKYLSSWLQWALARPNSAFRTEKVQGLTLDHEGQPLALVAKRAVSNANSEAGLPTLLPKEAWLVNKCKTELAEGRKVLVYLRQTGTRDIRARILEILHAAGLPAQNLPDNVSPLRREAWVERQQPQILITNPKRVETGLDLVMYHTAVFYEIEYSLYTLWQACRRIWRPGQTRPVKVYYVVYQDSMEEKAINLIGKKMAAGQMLYGDDVAGALVEDSSEGFINDLIDALKKEQRGEKLTAIENLFDQDDGTTESAAGSPTRKSPTLDAQVIETATMTLEWLRSQGVQVDNTLTPRKLRQIAQPKGRRRKTVHSEDQLILF